MNSKLTNGERNPTQHQVQRKLGRLHGDGAPFFSQNQLGSEPKSLQIILLILSPCIEFLYLVY